jgi:hypothetical protein
MHSKKHPDGNLLVSLASSAYGEDVGCFKASEALQVQLRREPVERHVKATGLAYVKDERDGL